MSSDNKEKTSKLEEKCKHPILKFIGNQETLGVDIPLGDCYYCHSTITISKAYREVVEGIYEFQTN